MTIQDRINEAAEAVAHLPGSLGNPLSNATLAIMLIQAIDRLTHAVERAGNLVGDHDDDETI